MRLLSAGLSSLVVAGAVFAAASTSMAPGRWFTNLNSTSTDNAYVRGDITPISPRISGYITQVAIHDNQPVKTGDVLFRIDDSDYRARVDQAAAGIATRRALLSNLSSRIDLQSSVVGQSIAALRGAEADATRAARNFARTRALNKGGWASQSINDEAEAEDLRARAKIAEAQANLEAARQQMKVVETQRPQLEADVAAALAEFTLVEIELANTVVRSPTDGWVGERQARVGQYVRAGTLLTAVVARNFWVVANFKETQLNALRVGESIDVSVDGIPQRKFIGHIESLSPASGAQFALLPPDNATGNFTHIVQRVPVKIVFEQGQPDLDVLRPGMSALVALPSSRP
ncbi:HlyD family secretion protein [Mesorhizobium opportunistum]|uniref:HlyD family secretion protein n=1 Tax=Mesorhizobium opportunistum TaxID=593909 RepID=UPI00333D4081